MCLDGDNPGKAAAYKLGEEFLKEKIEVKVVTLPNNDDPDSFILKEGKEKFARYIEEAENYNDYKIRVMRDNVNFQSDIEKANYINNVLKELTEVNDEIRIEIILKKLAKEFNLGYNTLEKKFSNIKNNKPQEEIKFVPKNTSKRKDKYRQAIEQVIYYMLTNEWVISEVDKERLLLPDDKIRILVQEIIYYYKTYGAVSIADFYTYLQDKQELLETFNSILNSNYNDEVSKEVLYLYFDVIRENVKNKEIKRLEEKLVK